jgi:OOP family OmpA-OmpF porin
MSLRLKPVMFAVVAPLVVLSLAACGKSEPAQAPAAEAAAVAAPAAPATFDLSGVPVSTAPLAPSPYFSAPAGYRVEAQGAIQKTAFPIWLGNRFQTVEGDVHWMRIGAESGKTLSRVEVSRAFDVMVQAAGSVKVASGQVSEAAVSALPETMRQELLDALGDNTNSPTMTYVIRRADKTIWVHSVVSIEVAYLSTVDAPPFAATPAS